MSPEFYAALLNFAAKFGINAAISFLENRGATIDDAIVALGKAEEKRLSDYIREDAQARLTPPAAAVAEPPAPVPPPGMVATSS